MAKFFDILPPPQSLDSLDAWGALDALSASLDDGFWTRVGVYGLSASEKGRTGQSFSAVRRRGLDLASSARSGGTLSLGRIGALTAEGSALSGGACALSRDVHLAAQGGAGSRERLASFRVRLIGAAGDAVSKARADASRLRTLSGTLCAFGTELGVLVRVRLLVVRDAGCSYESLFPEYKGWMWTERETAVSGAWKAMVPEASDWTPVAAGSAEWQGVVEWQ